MVSPAYRNSFLVLLAFTSAGATFACASSESKDDGGDFCHIGVPVDVTGDGVPDVIDFNNDGILDGVGLDIDNDLNVDGIGIDSDGDGCYEGIDVDLDGVDDSDDLGIVRPGTGGGSGTGGALATGGTGTGATGAGSGGDSATGGGNAQSGPLVMGYIYDWSPTSANINIDLVPYQNVDYIVHAFVTADASGNVVELEAFPHQRQNGLVQKVHAAGKKVVLSLGGAGATGPMAQIIGTPAAQTFANNVAARMVEWGYDGVDFDYEFPGQHGTPAQFTQFFTQIRDAVKAAKPDAIVMFGISPGWWIASYEWSQLGQIADYGFYFCYDWNNPQSGPVTRPGGTYNANGTTLSEASCRGALDYMIGAGFPAEKIVVGLPFSSSGYESYRNAPAAVKTGTPDPASMEVSSGGAWWPNVAAIEMKTRAFLDPSQSVLCSLPAGDCSGGAVAKGVGFWHLGQDNYESGSDLSTAMRNTVDSLK